MSANALLASVFPSICEAAVYDDVCENDHHISLMMWKKQVDLFAPVKYGKVSEEKWPCFMRIL